MTKESHQDHAAADQAGLLDQLEAEIRITSRMARAGRIYRDDWLASCRMAKRRETARQGTAGGGSAVSWVAIYRDRYRRAGQALGPWRPAAMLVCCGVEPKEGLRSFADHTIRRALMKLVDFYGL